MAIIILNTQKWTPINKGGGLTGPAKNNRALDTRAAQTLPDTPSVGRPNAVSEARFANAVTSRAGNTSRPVNSAISFATTSDAHQREGVSAGFKSNQT